VEKENRAVLPSATHTLKLNATGNPIFRKWRPSSMALPGE